jgi:hypothetical protein
MKINDKSSEMTISEQDNLILTKLARFIIYEGYISEITLKDYANITVDEYTRLIEINLNTLYATFISGLEN